MRGSTAGWRSTCSTSMATCLTPRSLSRCIRLHDRRENFRAVMPLTSKAAQTPPRRHVCWAELAQGHGASQPAVKRGDVAMPMLKRPDGEIHFETYGSGFPVLLFAPGGLRSRIE